MSQAQQIKIGFLGSSPASSPHHDSFRKFIPADIDFTFMQETGTNSSLYDAKGKVDALIAQSQTLIAEHGWDGLIISGGPKEALNPGMWQAVSTAIAVPVSLALRSSTAALRAFGAKRILLMSPVDDQLKKLYHDYLAGFGIAAFFPAAILRAHTDAQKLSSAEVEAMTRDGLKQFAAVDAIYFQGALLDPIPILEKLEGELNLPIVASNPAMLWLVLSKLGRQYNIKGYGKLLSSWPNIPPGPF
jgi:maleate cis-trans isomerase